MLLPAFGDARLAGEQGAQILKRDPLGGQRNQHRSNSDGSGSPSPPTPKRNSFPLTQRDTENVLPPPRRRGGDNATVFIG
jgi:hypothetical protein